MKTHRLLAALLSSLFVTTVFAPRCAAQAGLIKSGFIYETAPFPSCHATTIVETKNGLVAAWFGGTSENPGVNSPDSFFCLYGRLRVQPAS